MGGGKSSGEKEKRACANEYAHTFPQLLWLGPLGKMSQYESEIV